MHQSRIKHRNRHVVLTEQHSDLGPIEDQAIRAAVDKTLGNGDISRLALFGDNIAAKFLVDNAVGLGSVCRLRYDRREARRSQPLGVE